MAGCDLKQIILATIAAASFANAAISNSSSSIGSAQVIGGTSGAQTTLTTTTEPSGLGNIILAGIGVSSTTSQQQSSDSTSNSPPSPTPSSTPAPTVSLDCQVQLASWSTITSNIRSPYLTNTTIVSGPYSTIGIARAFSGSAYTTVDGFARVSGDLSEGDLSQYTAWFNTSATSWNVVATPMALANASIPPSPSCSIPASSCAQLYSAYESSLDLPTATGEAVSLYGPSIPLIWPVPSNSPRCTNTLNGCTFFDAGVGCSIIGSNVQVYYWPDAATSSVSLTGPPVTQIVGSITMTSPTVYLSMDVLSALTQHNEDGFCQPINGSIPVAAPGGATAGLVGSVVSNLLVSLLPTAVSTLERVNQLVDDVFAEFPDEALSAIAGPDLAAWNYWAPRLFGRYDYGSVVAKQMTFSDLTRPGVRPYYLRPLLNNPPGCTPYINASGCNTIYEEMYAATLSIPDVIKSMVPAWSACLPAINGLYDPPIALTARASADGVMTTTYTSTSTSATPLASASDPLAKATSIAAALPDPSSTSQSHSAESAPGASTSIVGPDPLSDGKTSTSSNAIQEPPDNTISFSVLLPTQGHGTSTDPADPVTVAVATAPSTTFTFTSKSGAVVFGSITVPSGQATTVDGLRLSNAGTAVVIQQTSQAPIGQIVDPPGVNDILVASLTIPVTNSALTVPGLHTVTLALTQPRSITVAGSVITANSAGGFVIGTQTLSAGSATTIQGTTYSLAPSDAFIVINGKTSSIASPRSITTTATYAIASGSTTASSSRPMLQIGGSSCQVAHPVATLLLILIVALLS